MITKTLSNGIEIPMLGYGVYAIKEEKECIRCVLDAIETGYRSFDTAAIYMNEPAVGKAIKESTVPRDQLFVTTKIWVQDAGYEKSKQAIDAALKRLQMDYVDLLLIHEPMGDIFGQWRAMEEAYRAGKVRALGVSNMYSDMLMNFILHVDVKPVINQVRTNPLFQHIDTHEFMKEYDIAHEAHSPFSQGNKEVLENELLSGIAQKYHKSVGQVVLHWLIQRDIVTLTKSLKKERMKENMDIFDFSLSEDEMEAIRTLDRADGNVFDNRNPQIVKAICESRYKYE